MTGKRIVMVQKFGGSLMATVPADICRAFNIRRGDSLYVEAPQEGVVLLRKINTIT